MLVQCADESLLEHASIVCREEACRPHQSLASSTDYYIVVAAVPVFARLGAHHVCIPELCPWIDLHAALFVTLPVTLGRANLPSAWSPPDAQKSATRRPISRPAQPLGSMCFPLISAVSLAFSFVRTVRLIDSSCHSLCIVPSPAHMAI